MLGRVLFVDDEPQVTDGLKRALHREPYEILTAPAANQALELLAGGPVDVVISDDKMPGMSGSEFLSIVRREYPDTIRIILTGQANLDTFTRAVQQGQVYRFFIKPCNEVDLAVTIRQALEQKKLMSESRRLVRVLNEQYTLLEQLEQKYPGITEVRKDQEGVVLVDAPQGDAETLIQQIITDAERAEKFLGRAK